MPDVPVTQCRDREVAFVRIPIPSNFVIVSCRECAAIVADDVEGANRAEHEAFHRRLWATLRALRDGKADAPPW